MSAAMDELVERSVELKAELLEYAYTGSVGRELIKALVERFGDPITASEQELADFVDGFVLIHRLGDGRTAVERFVRARGDLSRADRDFMRNWKDPVAGLFEVEAFEGEILVTSNVIDDLTYRLRSNMGGQLLCERAPLGSVLTARVIPVLDEWLISGAIAVNEPEHRDSALATAVSLAQESPRLLFRNPDRLRIGWEMQQADRARFMEFFGSDLVTLPREELATRWAQYWRFRHGDSIEPAGLDLLEQADTVGLIYDEREGLGFYADFGAFQEVCQRPELVTRQRYAQVVLRYLHDNLISPVPLRRCAVLHPGGLDVVLAKVLRRKQFTWQRHGEGLLRQYKPGHLDLEPLPLFLPFGPRLVEFIERTNPTKG